MCSAYRVLAALGVLAASYSAARAEASSPVYWAVPHSARPAVRAAFHEVPRPLDGRTRESVAVQQIGTGAALRRKAGRIAFQAWYARRYCGQRAGLRTFCSELSPPKPAGSGAAPPEPAGSGEEVLLAPIPVAAQGPYVPVRRNWLHPELEPRQPGRCPGPPAMQRGLLAICRHRAIRQRGRHRQRGDLPAGAE